MSDFRSVVKDYSVYGSTADMEYLSDKIDEFIEDVEGVDNFVDSLEMYICPFKSRKIVEKLTDRLKNEDGSTGAHWSYDQVEEVAKKHGVTKLNEFYFVLNMMWADYYNSNFTTEDYVRMAVQFMHDKDAPDDKTIRYIRSIVLS